MTGRAGISDPGEKIGDWIVHGIFGLPAGLGDARDQTVKCSFPEGEARDAILAYECMTPTTELASVHETNWAGVPRKTSEGLVVALGLQFCAQSGILFYGSRLAFVALKPTFLSHRSKELRLL